MAYLISFTRRARRDYLQLYESINAAQSLPAQAWLRRMEESMQLLAVTPRMGVVTQEDARVRQIVYGNKPHL